MRTIRQGGSKQTSILIDGANLHATCAALGFNVDYKKLVESFDGSIWKNYYFTAIPPNEEYSSIRPMIDYLQFNGFTVIMKPTKELTSVTKFTCQSCNIENSISQTRTKGNMDVEIAVIAKEIAPYVDHVVLFTGDGDFCFLIEALQRTYGTYVTVVSTVKGRHKLCSDDLRRQADDFVDLADIRQHVERTEDQRSTARRNFLNGS